MKPNVHLLTVLTLIAGVGCSRPAPALAKAPAARMPVTDEVYNVDFGNDGTAYAGRGLLGDLRDQKWQKLATPVPEAVPLQRGDGSPGAVTLTASGFAGPFQAPPYNDRFAWDNFGDYWFLNRGATATLTFDHLQPGGAYRLMLYALPGSTGRVVSAGVPGGTVQQTSGENGITWNVAPGPQSNCLLLSGEVAPDGKLEVTLGALGPDVYGDLQGLQLQVGAVAPPMSRPATGYGSMVRNLNSGRDQTALFVGTSLTAGLSWPTALQGALANQFEGRLKVCDRAIPATRSTSGVAGIAAWLAQDKPDAVFIEYGMNDAWTPALTLDQSKANLDTMVAAITAATPQADIILLTMNNPAGKNLEQRPDIEAYYGVYRDYAAAHHMTLIDDYPLWKKLYDTDPTLWNSYVPDAIHPSLAGNRAVVVNNMVLSLERGAGFKDEGKAGAGSK